MSTGLQRAAAQARRKRRGFGVCTAAVAAAVAVAGCANAPIARFHSLLAPPAARDTPAAAARELPRGMAWTLAPVLIPAQVDRAQWVVRAPDDTLAVLENERWIAPLADELRAALAERLARSLGVEGSMPAAGRNGWRVAVAVQRFDSQPARAARLEAVWTLGLAEGANAAALVCRSRIEQPVGAGYPALAAGHRQALAQLAEAIAAALATLDRGAAAECPR